MRLRFEIHRPGAKLSIAIERERTPGSSTVE